MVSIQIQQNIVNVQIDALSEKKAKQLADFLEEQAELWLNKSKLQKELDELDREPNEVFKFV